VGVTRQQWYYNPNTGDGGKYRKEKRSKDFFSPIFIYFFAFFHTNLPLLALGLIRHKRISGYWLLAAGHWSLASGFWLLATSGSILPAGCSIRVRGLRRLRKCVHSTFSFERYFRLVVFRPGLSSRGSELSFSGLIWQGLIVVVKKTFRYSNVFFYNRTSVYAALPYFGTLL
jgi:hypothetical protein